MGIGCEINFISEQSGIIKRPMIFQFPMLDNKSGFVVSEPPATNVRRVDGWCAASLWPKKRSPSVINLIGVHLLKQPNE